ncbi:MAG: LexA family protein [Candidatus Egerieousia sp.]
MEIHGADQTQSGTQVKKGFSAQAHDYMERGIDLNRELIHNPASTFFGRVSGDAMSGAGLEEDDIVVIDKSLQAKDGDIAVCYIDGEFTLRRVSVDGEFLWLTADNPKYRKIKVDKSEEFPIWGVVTYSIKDIRRKNGGKA